MEDATTRAGDATSPPARELRCHCGSLIARLVDGKLEVKCRRCRRVGLIDLAALGVEPAAIEISWRAEPDGVQTKAKRR